MLPDARLGDMVVGVCPAHVPPVPVTGSIVVGSGVVMTDYLPQARLGDMAVCSCGHPTTIITGSPMVLSDYMPNARLTDQQAGPPITMIVLGSSVCLSQ